MPFQQRLSLGNERLRTAYSVHQGRLMKKDRVQKKTALELKLARIRQLTAEELGVAQGGEGRCRNDSIACNTASCNDTQ